MDDRNDLSPLPAEEAADKQSEQKRSLRGIAANIGKGVKNAAGKVSVGVKDGAVKIGEKWDALRTEADLKKLNPVFREQLTAPDFVFPPIIQIVDYDKRIDNKVCEGSVGYETIVNSVRILTVYTPVVSLLPMRFYPKTAVGVYHADPCFPDLYVDVNEYFAYMKKERVDELERVAQKLGAKHFRVTFNEQNREENASAGNGKLSLFKLSGSGGFSRSEKNYANVTVAADISFSGSDKPVRPELVYFKDDTDVRSLIEMRTSESAGNKIHSKTYSIEYGKTSGIRYEETADLKSALKQIKCGAAETFTSNAVRENRTVLEYTIEF